MPPPFKLEREVTLMPNEFRERLSAKHKSRKTSAARPGMTRSHSSKPATGKFRYSTENSYHSSNYGNDSTTSQSPVTEARYVKSVKISKDTPENVTSPQSSLLSDTNNNIQGHGGELQSKTSHIELSGEVKFMLDNAYANYEAEGGFSVRTPPKNMQIKDLMIPLDNWNNKEAIREKKYTVLPSINKTSKSPDESDSVVLSNRNSSGFSTNNQLDFFRDKIEQDADFFADFRVNTSKVKPTPRQNPLPPIRHDSKDFGLSNSASSKKSYGSPRKLSDRR